ncbi:protein I'm not dead yet-like [Cochliomyia hominivorax]
MLPIIFLPILGVMASQEVCMSYARDTQILLLLSIFIAATLEHCSLAKRLAFSIISGLSCNPKIILIILMIFSYILTAFLPAAFVCALIMPTVRSLLKFLDDISICKSIDESKELKDDERLYPSKVANAFYLGVAYAINIGGLSTAIASDSGLALRDIIERESSLRDMDNYFHFKYLLLSLPLSLILLLFTIFYLEIIFLGYLRSQSLTAQQIAFDREASKAALEEVGKELPPYNVHMILVGMLFFGSCIGVIVSSFLETEINDKLLKYSFNAMLLCFLYFILPSNLDFCNYFRCSKPSNYKPAPSVLTWSVVNKLTPWIYFFVHGSSVAFGVLMKKSELQLFLGEGLQNEKNLFVQQVGFMGLTAILTLMGCNNIVAEIMLNMAMKAKGNGDGAALLMYPITWSCCLTFLLPVSSTANCFAGGWGDVRAKEVMLAGIGPLLFGFLIMIIGGFIMSSLSVYD